MMDVTSAEWCLKDVDYTTVDFYPPPLPPSTYQPPPCFNRKRQLTLADAQKELRRVMLNKRLQNHIHKLVRAWPSHTLKLVDFMSSDDCTRAMNNPEVIWLQMFEAFLSLDPVCKISCLDVTGYMPDRGMVHTLLQLIPLLTLATEMLQPDYLLAEIKDKLRLEDPVLVRKLHGFLRRILQHPVYKSGKTIRLPGTRKHSQQSRGDLELVIDRMPLRADSLSFLSLLTAVGLEKWTKVAIKVKSFIYTFGDFSADQPSFDPFLPLSLAERLFDQDIVSGVSVTSIPISRHADLMALQWRWCNLRMLSLADCGLNLQTAQHSHWLYKQLSMMTSLQRLDVTGAIFLGHLGDFLTCLHSPLTHLNLTHCQLNTSDITTLSNWFYADSLLDLNVSHLDYSADVVVSSSSPSRAGNDYNCEIANFDIHLASSLSLEVDTNGRHSVSPPRTASVLSGDTVDSGVGDDSSICSISADCSFNQLETNDVEKQCQQDGGVTDGVPVAGDVVCCSEDDEKDLWLHVVNNLYKLRHLVIVNLNTNAWTSRPPSVVLTQLRRGLCRLSNLRYACLTGIPLNDQDIHDMVGLTSTLHDLNKMTLTRDPTLTIMSIEQRFLFWETLHRIKRGHRLNLTIDNLSGREMTVSLMGSDVTVIKRDLNGGGSGQTASVT